MQKQVNNDYVPASLPPDSVPPDVDVSSCQAFLEQALRNLQPTDFQGDCFWRDWMCFSKRIRTRRGVGRIMSAWKEAALQQPLQDLKISPARVTRRVRTSWVDVPFTFSTIQTTGLHARCSAYASLVPAGHGGWKIWSLVTILEQFAGHGDPDLPPTTKTELTAQDHYDVVIMGAGQAGLAIAGRLKTLGLKYLVIEKDDQISSRWRKRYDSARLHTPLKQNQLPFSYTWSDDEELYLPGWKFAREQRQWAERYSINVWLNTDVISAKQDGAGNAWRLRVVGKEFDDDHPEKQITCRHLILALGFPTRPYSPVYPGRDLFEGDAIHTTQFKNGDPWKGKRAIVIGSGVNGHDVSCDLIKAGCDNVWMIQRSTTAVWPVQTVEPGYKATYDSTLPVHIIDKTNNTRPHAIWAQVQDRAMRIVMDQDFPTMYDDLEKVGFRVDRNGLYDTYRFVRGGGYYLDVGGSQLLLDGRIKVKSGVPIKQFTKYGLLFEDGSEIQADLVVYATGFHYNEPPEGVEDFLDPDVVSKMGSFWGFDEEGEVRGLAHERGTPRLWTVGGSTMQARFYSRFVALQVQADLLCQSPDS